MTKDFEINESANKYFDVISESDTPLQVSLYDKNNAKLASLCKKLDQLYSLRSKLKEDFFNYLESDQYYFDIYQTIKCLGLATPSLKSHSVEPTGYYKFDSPSSYRKLLREYHKKLSPLSKVNLKPIENNNIQLKKMRGFVENHLIHILVSDAYEAVWSLKDNLHIFGKDGNSKRYSDKAGPTDSYIEESNKIKIYLKKKSNEKLDVYIRRIKKMFTEMHDDNILQFNAFALFKIYKNKQNLYCLPKSIEFGGDVDIVDTINFKDDFSKFFDGIKNNLISLLLFDIYKKKSLSIEANYKKEIEKIEQGISTDCLYLKKKMNINYSINLCEKLIKDGFDSLNNTFGSGYRNSRDYLDIFQNEMFLNNYNGGRKYVPEFYVHRTKFYQEENLQHPLDLNGDDLIKELDLLAHNNITLGHSSYLFNKLFVKTNTIHDAVSYDKFGDPNPVNEDCTRSMNARFILSKDLIDQFQNFINQKSTLKSKQKNIDWIQLELINYFEDNQDIFIAYKDRYKSLLLLPNEILFPRIKGILFDYEGHEKEIQKLRKKVYLNYKKITKNQTQYDWAELEEIIRFKDKIAEENPKHKRFAYSQIDLYEDPYNYDYRIKNFEYNEARQAVMTKRNDKEPFSNHNISLLRQILKKEKDQLSEEDEKYLRGWYINYSEMKRFHNKPKFLSSNHKKIFNFDDFFKFERHFLEPDNKDLKNLLSQLFNYINIDQNIATVFQELMEKKIKNDISNRDHNLFSEFPQIKIKNNNDYERGIWWLINNFINTQKSHIYHSFNNSLKDIILRALLFIRGIYPYRSGSGMKDPYERIITELTKAISFYDSFSEQIYRDKISITASLLTNEIINSLRCIRDYIYTLKIANAYEIKNGKINNIVNNDIKKNDLQFISRSPQWRNEIPIDFDLAIKKYLKECNKRKKGENENFINKQVYDKKGKQVLKTAKNNKSLIDRNSALKWLKERSGKYKLNELKVAFNLEEDIGFNNYGLYRMTGDAHIKLSD